MRSRRILTALVLTGGCALAAAGVAAADAGKSPRPAVAAPAAAPGKAAPGLTAAAVRAKLPKGYTVVRSGPLLASDGGQTRGFATCPAGLVPLGGGVFVDSVSTLASVNSSFPAGNGWDADVNNASGAATTFEVRVVCAKAPKRYVVVLGNAAANPVGTQTSASVPCPAGTSPLGGGGLSSSGQLFANMNSTLPSGRGWRVDENNAGNADATITPLVICGRVKGYVVAAGALTTTPAGGQTISRAICPGGGLPIGGGVLSFSGSLAVNINTTAPTGIEWDSYINDATAFDVTEEAIAICAGAQA